MPMPRKPDGMKHCAECARLMTRRRYGKRLEDLGAFARRRYCSRRCMAGAYVSDTSSPGAKRRRVLKFRGEICESCGDTTKLHAHHIDGNLSNDSPENIQTLCASCHASHHHRARRAGRTVAGRMD